MFSYKCVLKIVSISSHYFKITAKAKVERKVKNATSPGPIGKGEENRLLIK